MGIKKLAMLVTPPVKKVEITNDSARDAVKKHFGFQLPKDLWAVSETYGSGIFFASHLEIYNPLSKKYQKYIETQLALLEDLADSAVPLPYDVHPERPGLFPLARDSNGHYLLWLTEGAPNSWPIVALRREGDHELYDVRLIDFLAGVFQNKIRCINWTTELTAENRSFRPKKM